MMRRILVIGVLTTVVMTGLSPPPSIPVLGVVMDAVSREPVANAIVTVGRTETRTDARGMFRAPDSEASVRVRAHGYGRAEVAIETLRRPPAEIRLARVRPKALYLSVFGSRHRHLRIRLLES